MAKQSDGNRKEREKRLREQEVEDLRQVLGTKFGRRVIWRYLSLCGVFATSFDGSSRTFFQEGKRVIGLTLVHDIQEVNPKMFGLMMEENFSKEG